MMCTNKVILITMQTLQHVKTLHQLKLFHQVNFHENTQIKILHNRLRLFFSEHLSPNIIELDFKLSFLF